MSNQKPKDAGGDKTTPQKSITPSPEDKAPETPATPPETTNGAGDTDTPNPPAPPEAQIETRTVIGEMPLNIRSKPNGKVIDSVEPGTELEVAGPTEDGWVPVMFLCYVREEFTKEAK